MDSHSQLGGLAAQLAVAQELIRDLTVRFTAHTAAIASGASGARVDDSLNHMAPQPPQPLPLPQQDAGLGHGDSETSAHSTLRMRLQIRQIMRKLEIPHHGQSAASAGPGADPSAAGSEPGIATGSRPRRSTAGDAAGREASGKPAKQAKRAKPAHNPVHRPVVEGDGSMISKLRRSGTGLVTLVTSPPGPSGPLPSGGLHTQKKSDAAAGFAKQAPAMQRVTVTQQEQQIQYAGIPRAGCLELHGNDAAMEWNKQPGLSPTWYPWPHPPSTPMGFVLGATVALWFADAGWCVGTCTSIKHARQGIPAAYFAKVTFYDSAVTFAVLPDGDIPDYHMKHIVVFFHPLSPPPAASRADGTGHTGLQGEAEAAGSGSEYAGSAFDSDTSSDSDGGSAAGLKRKR